MLGSALLSSLRGIPCKQLVAPSVQGKSGVDGLADASDAELASSSEEDEEGGAGGESDIDSEEEQRRWEGLWGYAS